MVVVISPWPLANVDFIYLFCLESLICFLSEGDYSFCCISMFMAGARVILVI